MKVLVTGAHGKVGRALVPPLAEAGHDVRASDLTRPVWDRVDPGEPEDYWQVDLTDAGAAYALVAGCDAVVHTAAIPQPTHNAPHVVFENNMMSTFNLLEAAIAGGVQRFVHFSSETVPGFIFAHRPFEPDYLPIDEEHPIRPQDAYATAKWFGELLCDRAVERVGHPLHVDPAVVGAGRGKLRAEPRADRPRPVRADRELLLLHRRPRPQPTRSCSRSRPTCQGTRCSTSHPPTRSAATRSRTRCGRTTAPSASSSGRPRARTPRPISTAKAERLLGWTPTRSWRDYLDDEGRARR